MRERTKLRSAFRLAVLTAAGLIGLGLVLARTQDPRTPKDRELFWTWDKLEPDTVACAWLLRRFAAPGCEIRLVADRGRSNEGIAFDVPLADLTRDRTRSSFRVIRERYGLKDPALERLGRWIDEIEIRGWAGRPSGEAARIERDLRRAIAGAATGEAALESCARILDALYGDLSESKKGER